MSVLKNSISWNFDWREVAWQYNTGNGYHHKQDLIAVFANGFEYIKQKVEVIWDQTGEFDEEFLEELVWEFRLSFPISGRVEGVNYYDDLILMLIGKYRKRAVASKGVNTEQSSEASKQSVEGNDLPLKLSHPQIAILYHIADWPINGNNGNEIAKKYGQNSGQRLEQTYNDLTSELVRTAKGKNRVKDYKAISNLIPANSKEQYIRELKIVIRNNKKE